MHASTERESVCYCCLYDSMCWFTLMSLFYHIQVIKCTGRLITKTKTGGKQQGGGASAFFPYLLAIGEPIPHPANIEIPMDNNTFLSKHDMSLRFTYCDERYSRSLFREKSSFLSVWFMFFNGMEYSVYALLTLIRRYSSSLFKKVLFYLFIRLIIFS